MKKIGILALVAVIALASCKNYKSVKVKTDVDSISYLIGLSVGKGIKANTPIGKVNPDAFAKGIAEVFSGDSVKLTDMDINMKIQGYIQKMEKKAGETNKLASEAFMEKNKSAAGVTVTPSGLQYIVIKQGTGPKPDSSDVVSVNYKGTLIDGIEFDSNKGGPASLPLKGVFPGMTEALLMMPVGSKYKLFIPSKLAYGENAPQGGKIKANMALIFEIEILSINPKPVVPPAAPAPGPKMKMKK